MSACTSALRDGVPDGGSLLSAGECERVGSAVPVWEEDRTQKWHNAAKTTSRVNQCWNPCEMPIEKNLKMLANGFLDSFLH